jgi:hypothetical protein
VDGAVFRVTKSVTDNAMQEPHTHRIKAAIPESMHVDSPPQWAGGVARERLAAGWEGEGIYSHATTQLPFLQTPVSGVGPEKGEVLAGLGLQASTLGRGVLDLQRGPSASHRNDMGAASPLHTSVPCCSATPHWL